MHDPALDDDAPPGEEPFARAFAVADLPPGEAKMVPVGDYDIAIFNVGGEFFAVDDVCPHFAASLALGRVDGDMVVCPMHGWCFSLNDGRMLPAGRRSIATFDVRVEDGDVFVSREPRAPV